jgi:glycosyltransferase involved in cell wall biosynthesis
METQKILFIDFCNYVDYQIGGHLSFAKNMLTAFGTDMSLIGISTEQGEPIGTWFKKTIDGKLYDYFALARYNKHKTKYMIPDRLACFLLLRWYKRKILSKGFKNVFVQRQEIIPAIKRFGYLNICYCFPTLENPLTISKYGYSKYVSRYFDKLFFSALDNVKALIANGDDNAITELKKRGSRYTSNLDVKKFPVRIDVGIFKPVSKKEARENLSLSEDSIIVMTSGRLASVKGWEFMIDCFYEFTKQSPKSLFIMVGEGEDLNKIKGRVKSKGIEDKVMLPGMKGPKDVAAYLNAADVYIMGSYKEGWSTSLSEAISCGTPSCVNDFSSARDIVIDGVNGFVINNRNNAQFVQSMFKALDISRPVFNNHVRALSTDTLKTDLLKVWTLI